jgi:hypothetical protein
MKGLRVKYSALARLLKKAREREGLSLEMASQFLGLGFAQNPHIVEKNTRNISAPNLRKAIGFYKLDRAKVVELVVKDFEAALKNYLGEKE